MTEQREEIERFARETETALEQHVIANPFFGPLNGYQWRAYIPLHTMRHHKQIGEAVMLPGCQE